MNNVHNEEVIRINTIVTSKEALLAASRKIVMEQGITAVNMRTVANSCGVSVGSIYNYFPSKADLIGAAVEEVWRDIFQMPEESFCFKHFTDVLLWLFERVMEGCKKYPGFFTVHSMSFAAEDKTQGRRMMEQYFGQIKHNLLMVLRQDCKVRQDAFNKYLTQEQFIDFIFTNFVTMVLQRKEHCEPLVEIAVRCIY